MERTALSRPWKNLPFGGLSANALRLLAMAGMLLDHLWGTVVSGHLWMTCVGRLGVSPLRLSTDRGLFCVQLDNSIKPC